MIHKKFDELRLTGKLPSPSSVGLRVLRLTQDDDYVQEELTNTIAADPALAGRIIKLANTAERENGGSVESVMESAMRLGATTIRNVALGFTLVSDNRSGICENFDYKRYWSESLATAVAVEVLARAKKIYEPAEAFTCALLCDVGKLALASVHPEKYAAMLAENPVCSDRELGQNELREFDITHSEVSAAMMADWGLPSVFREAVLLHELDTHTTDDDSGRTWALVTLLRAGKRISSLLVSEADTSSDEWRQKFYALGEAANSLGIQVEELYTISDAIQKEWQSWGKQLGVSTEGVTSFTELARDLERRATEVAEGGDPPQGSTGAVAPLASPSFVAGQGKPTRILLIDDDERMLRLIRHHLRRENYEIFTAQSSHEGLQKALDLVPQLVITDWMMPGMSGVKLCETLRQSEAGRKMYVLIVTAREDDEQVVEAFASGADDYVVKPFNPRILLARVRAGQRMIRMREQVEESERVRLRQVAELGILTRKLRAAAMTDALTELPNRRYAMNRLKQEWDSAVRTGRPLSVIMLDIDHFKRVNDVYGHDIGDVVLKETAQALRAKTRGGDVLCRLGGEEFLSINIGCDTERALVCGERLRAAVELHAFEHDEFDWNVTISLGVAEWSAEHMSCVDDLLKESDQALYVAKDSGRNQVIVRDDPSSRTRSA